MAKLWYLDREIVRLTKTEAEELEHGEPTAFDGVIEFDTDTNQDVIVGLDTDWNAHAVEGGILKRAGIEVVLNAAGQVYLDRQAVHTSWADLNTAITFVATARMNWPGLSAAEKQIWLAQHFDEVLKILEYVLKFRRWLVRSWMKLSGL